MIKTLLNLLDRISPPQEIYAHCDIPCGIYDPHAAQIAAHTVLRMAHLLKEERGSHEVARLARVKEEHAEIVKHEVRIIWGDYFKEEHVKKYPDIHEKVFKIMKLASQAKQEKGIKVAEELLEKVQDFSEIFWSTKDVQTTKVRSNYPTGGLLILPK